MKKSRSRFIVWIIITLTLIGTAKAQFDRLETEHLRLIYFRGAHSFIAPYTARCFENSLQRHRQLWGYTPSEKITIFLHDFSDYGNGGASATPINRVTLSIAPLNYTYETSPANERINSTMNHELTHLVALDQSCGFDSFFRTIFNGKVVSTYDNPVTFLYNYLTNPRRSAPLWYHEGIAVFMETWMAGGLGRALGAYDEMVFRTKVRENAIIYSRLGLESEGTRIDFQVGINSYLYGARFYSYLALKYGPEKLLDWVNRDSDSDAFFSSQFKKTFGLDVDQAWSEWIDWENEFQRDNLDTIRAYPVTNTRRLAIRPLGSVSRGFYDPENNKLYVAVNFPGKVPHIAAIDMESGQLEKLEDVKGAAMFYVTSMAYDSSRKILFYSTDNSEWRDLRMLDLSNGKSKTLLKDERIGDLTFNHADSSIWGIRHFNGYSTIIRIPYPYKEWKKVYVWSYGKDMYDIDISPDGSLLIGALAEISGCQSLLSIEIDSLMSDSANFNTLYDFGNSIPANFVFSSDGRYAYGSSYYTGVSNIFRYDFARDSMEAVSNCETGLFRPISLGNDSLIAFQYTSQGFVPVKLADTTIEDINPIMYLGQKVIDTHPVLSQWMAGSPADINLDTMIIETGSYNALAHLNLHTVYPIVEGYKEYPAYGLRFNISDDISMHNLDLTVSYTPNSIVDESERIHINTHYSYSNWSLSYKHNGADFYDLFGPTKTSRKGNSLGLKYKRALIYDSPKFMNLAIGLNGYWKLDRLPDYQNINTTYDRFLSGNVSLSYSNMKASLGAVDYEKGFSWSLSTSGNLVNRKYFPRTYTTLDIGVPLPIGHSSFWVRSAAGYAHGDHFNPFANFYFGGFGNNWVDYQGEKRYRRYYAFPGWELNEINGTDFVRVMGEINLPPLLFRSIGIPSFYFTWARLSLFSTGLITNMGHDDTRRKVANLGTQLDFRAIMMSHFTFTFSIGYAASFEKSYKPTDEFMFSVRIM